MSANPHLNAQAFLLTVVSGIDDYACESVVECIEVLSEDMNVPQAIGVIADGLFEMDKQQAMGRTSALLNQSMLYALWRVGLLAIHNTILDKTVERISLILEVNFEMGHTSIKLTYRAIEAVYDMCIKEASNEDLWVFDYTVFNLHSQIRNKLSTRYTTQVESGNALICSTK